MDSITPYVAIERGFFKKNGLDAEVVEFRGDATHVKALLSGDIDLSINMGATEAMVSASKKAPIKLLVVANPITPYHFVARKEAGTTLQALIGKNIAVSGIGAISYHIPRIVLERSGIDPEKFKYVAVGSPADRFKALVAGKVDATVVTNTEAAKLASYPEIIDLVSVAKVVPESLRVRHGTGRLTFRRTPRRCTGSLKRSSNQIAGSPPIKRPRWKSPEKFCLKKAQMC